MKFDSFIAAPDVMDCEESDGFFAAILSVECRRDERGCDRMLDAVFVVMLEVENMELL